MFVRHDLVWLSDLGWRHARATAPANCHDALNALDALDAWRQADWPAIVRRADADLLPDQLSIGIAMPPRAVDGFKMRIGLRVPRSVVKKGLPPLPVAHVIEAVPEPWQPLLAALESDAAGQGLAIRVYGSVALQALTRQPYLTAASDIDVLLRPTTGAELHHGLDLLNSYANRLPLDGEIVFPCGQAVSWKELSGALRATSGRRVLVKETHGVYLTTTSALMATMKEDACTG
jgi:phosphoribosyl-dephospho-CoA transferase